MTLSPGMRGKKKKFDICLTDRRSRDEKYLRVQGSIERSSFSPESLALDIRNQGKRVGDFDEQRSWRGGALNEYFSDDKESFYDSRHAWSLSHHLVPSFKWFLADGAYRVINENAGDDIRFVPLIDTNQYIEDQFTASAQTADYCRLWIRKRGNPGTLTLEITADSGGDPDAVAETVTKAGTDLLSDLSSFMKFDWTGTTALSGATEYHVKIYGAAADNDVNYWEVGVDPDLSSGQYSDDGSSWNTAAYGLHYRIYDADIPGRWFFWKDGDSLYKVNKKDSGNSVAYKWNETNDEWDAAGGTSGLGVVLNRPAFFNNNHYFPQGESVNIRRWDGTTTWAADGTSRATFLEVGFDSADGNTIWSANTTAGTTSSVKRAPAPSAGNLVFGDDINVGDKGQDINGLYFWTNNGLYVWQKNRIWQVTSDRVTHRDFGVKNTPSKYNGVAATGLNEFLYWSWLSSMQQTYGQMNRDVGKGWNSPSLPNERSGYISAMVSLGNWLYYAIDAGSSGTSSVWIYDGLTHHEVFRAYDTGIRIRDLAIQPVDDARTRLWVDCGVDSLYMELALNKANPLNDDDLKHHHEFEMISSTIDMGTASKLPKYISELTCTSKNLNGAGIRIEAYYQVDNDIGSSKWTKLKNFLISPEQTVKVDRGDITQFRYRIVGMTDDADVPPIIKGIVPNGYARTNFKLVWNMQVITGKDAEVDAEELDRWLLEVGRSPGRVLMTSTWRNLHDFYVVMSPPRTTPIRRPIGRRDEISVYNMTLIEA